MKNIYFCLTILTLAALLSACVGSNSTDISKPAPTIETHDCAGIVGDGVRAKLQEKGIVVDATITCTALVEGGVVTVLFSAQNNKAPHSTAATSWHQTGGYWEEVVKGGIEAVAEMMPSLLGPPPEGKST